ncbi:MAG TPA: alpha-amylase family glycosyl hydrolase [bacterium]|nr:alpha-amylase family glycosyl hydrolase [bacterium]
MTGVAPVKRELHISRRARDKYQFEETLFAQHGDVIFADFHAVRKFVKRMNEKRNVIDFPEKAVRSGEINGMGLIHEILHYIIQQFRQQKNNQLFREMSDHLSESFDSHELEQILIAFADEFPPVKVYRRDMDVNQYLAGSTEGEPHKHIILEELILLWLSNNNPAFSEYLELFDDARLEKTTKYVKIMGAIEEFFDNQPQYGPGNENLLRMLQAPTKASPHSIAGQLEWIRGHWASILGKYFYRLLKSLDFIKEETKMRFGTPGPARAYDFTGDVEYERFSKDQDWMPKVVILAKNTYVWLDQLSKKYSRSITRLDQIPDEELDTLARRGFTGLWLIGLWERSNASLRIKQMMGNPDAVASAYSLYDYEIAQELGGQEAYNNLHSRAWERDIRLAGDMVPNHVGIDGKWVREHPDWFVSLDHSPFPSYSFSGPDLCEDDRVQLYLEDHYYDRSDAAVVFKRVDGHTGDEKYIYHGNDGTSMPWNDTAQLNFLNAEVREAVVQTILHVARHFSIIRFDAAMTLAKKHYQRLWFPEPGTGGDIPSRAEYGMTREDFDRVFPKEFWREVVDRVAEEEPDTLLLAEAFWLMEGYFVRTLGMHRVYNSAFMNMLKTEDNAKYRQTIKNVLEFNPEILKRFVNFMNNPDEETAVAQFGKDDKYFGVCVLLVTLPGLPMFGHGQVEGLTEKYGMEFKRAYWDEEPDQHLVQRHEREIFPLLHKRYVFAESKNFLLYDLYTPEGHVNENVFAYSNRTGDERALVVYNNKFDHARGVLHTSSAYKEKTGGGDQAHLVQKTIGEGLDLQNDPNSFCIFRDQISGLEYIRNNRKIYDQGFFVELGAFKYQVFLDFREVVDTDNMYAELTEYLDGRGVPSIDEALQETLLRPIHEATRSVFNTTIFKEWYDHRGSKNPEKSVAEIFDADREHGIEKFLREVKEFTDSEGDIDEVAAEITDSLIALLKLPVQRDTIDEKVHEPLESDLAELADELEDPEQWLVLFSWAFVKSLGKLQTETEFEDLSRSWIDDLLLNNIIHDLARELEMSGDQAMEVVELVKILTSFQHWFEVDPDTPNAAYRVMETLLHSGLIRDFLSINRYQDALWFNKESFEKLCWWLRILLMYDVVESGTTGAAVRRLEAHIEIVETFERAESESGFRVTVLLDALKTEESPVA